jgi:Family of unknown function (DUF5995)
METAGIGALIERMNGQLAELRTAGDARAAFHATYTRTTEAVGAALAGGFFLDAPWVEKWDIAFARLYLDALDADRRGEPVPRPWAVAFGAAAAPGKRLPELRLILLGMNAHINYDLPRALLAVISDAEFADPAVIARREADHTRIDEVLSGRVSAEDSELAAGGRSLTDRVLQPLNRLATKRLLRESRRKVWANAITLAASRRAEGQDGEGHRRQLARLEELSAARVADLMRPGPVLLRLAAGGFGVLLDEH